MSYNPRSPLLRSIQSFPYRRRWLHGTSVLGLCSILAITSGFFLLSSPGILMAWNAPEPTRTTARSSDDSEHLDPSTALDPGAQDSEASAASESFSLSLKEGRGKSRLAVGDTLRCQLETEGTLHCENRISSSAPDNGAFETLRFDQISTGRTHLCGIQASGRLLCWGEGRGAKSPAPEGRFLEVAAGNAHNCAIRDDGKVLCWGANGSKQATAPAGRFARIAVGDLNSCGILVTGRLICWGDDSLGQSSPPEGRYRALSLGPLHACAIDIEGQVECWGLDNLGQASPPSEHSFAAIASGALHSCGIDLEQTVHCWGSGIAGQDKLPKGRFVEIDAGRFQTCVRSESKEISCWGG